MSGFALIALSVQYAAVDLTITTREIATKRNPKLAAF